MPPSPPPSSSLFFFNDTATTEIYTTHNTLSLHDALPICGISVAGEDIGAHVGEAALRAHRHDAVARRVHFAAEFDTVSIGHAPVIAGRLEIREVGAAPGTPCLPREALRGVVLDRRGELPLVRPGEGAAAGRLDHEWLEILAAVIAATVGAPDERRLVLIARPRAGRRHASLGGRDPLRFGRGLPVVAPVLLAVAVRVPPAGRVAAARRGGSVRRRDIEALQSARIVAEPPDVERWVGVRATEGAYPGVEAARDLPRDHVDHAAQRRRAVERGARALHHLDPRDVLERDEVPIDPTPVALIRGHAVHEHQHAAAEPLHVARRAADVHLTVEELHSGSLVYGFVHGRDGPAGDVGIADERDARHRLAQEL